MSSDKNVLNKREQQKRIAKAITAMPLVKINLASGLLKTSFFNPMSLALEVMREGRSTEWLCNEIHETVADDQRLRNSDKRQKLTSDCNALVHCFEDTLIMGY